jgi:uncharacterized protein YndB with AHSA1/START domain
LYLADTNTDRIEKSVVLRAPIARVWRALTDPKEFGSWFRVDLRGGFSPGAKVQGTITHKGYEHLTWDVVVERMEPEHRFSWRWHPYAIDPKTDYSTEPPTLVQIELTEVPEGTKLTVVESGFDQLWPGRKEQVYPMNEGGWTAQMQSIKRHVEGPT